MTNENTSIDFNAPALAFVPIMDRKQFSQIVGITDDTLNMMVHRGQVPVINLGGKRSFVNLLALSEQCKGG